jgi:hypothetical protein
MPSRTDLMLRSAPRARLEARTAAMQHLVAALCAVRGNRLLGPDCPMWTYGWRGDRPHRYVWVVVRGPHGQTFTSVFVKSLPLNSNGSSCMAASA